MSINFELMKPSASMEVTRLASELKKAGKTVYPLSIGDTHFPPPNNIAEKLKSLPAAYSHYTNADGIDQLRKQVAAKYTGYNSNDVMMVPGLKQGLYYALEAIAGKNLCILEPAWLGYEAAAIMTGYSTVCINMQQADWISQMLQAKFDVIIVCAPNNPDGKIFNEKETSQIIEAAKKNNAIIITDFIYDRYDYEKSFPVFYNIIVQYPKIIIGNGFSKSHAMTGFRIGYLLCKDEQIKQRIGILQQNLATCVSSIGQYLLVDFEQADEEVDTYSAYYKKNKEIVLSVFPEWQQYEPQGGFYYFVDLKKYGIENAQHFCEKILQNTGIAMVPGSAYGKKFDSFVRLSFSVDTNTLIKALNLLQQQLNQLTL